MNENHVIKSVRRVTKNLFSKYVILAAMLCSFGLASAQNSDGNVSGTVLSESTNEPLIGVSVLIKGTTQGTVTDFNGIFKVQAKTGDILKFSYVGFIPQEIKVSGSTLNIRLKESENTLDELIVVGYGVQKKKLVTGATVSLRGDDLQKLNTTNALQAMQGQTAGVNITSISGQPGGKIKVNVRGVGTIGNSSPTYVVDGVITNDITYLDNSDIASIDVLKDAASCAIYGINGANGVVLITTRGGNFGKTDITKGQISFDTYYGVQNLGRKVNLLNASQYATIANEAAINSVKAPYFTQAQIANMGAGTDWVNQMFSKNVPTQSYNLAANGGNAASIYSVAFSYTQQGGVLGGTNLSNYERYNFRTNTEHKLYGNFLKVGEHMTFSHVNKKGVKDDDQYNNSLRSALSTSPFLAMYDANGKYLNSANSTFYNGGSWFNGESNPYAIMQLTNQNETKSDKLLGDAYAEIVPVKGLTLKSTFGLEYNGSADHSYLPVYALSVYAINTTDKITQNSSVNYTWNWDNTINYLLKVNKHTFDLLAGNSVRKYEGSFISGSNTGETLFGDFQHGYLTNSTTTSVSASPSTSDADKQTVKNTMSLTGNANAVIAHASFFGRANYNYNETYLASLVFRADGSTMFGKGYQWGYFPSLSAGWVITNEEFMSPTTDWLDFMKLRGSWGNNGNDNLPTTATFAYQSLIALANATYNIGGTDVTGSYASTIGTPKLKWETSEQLDFGFDANFLKGKFNLNFDWYKKTTKDWLVQAPITATVGISTDNAPWINGGNVTNSGVEIQLAYNDKIGKDFKYTITGTYTYNKNNVTDIPTADGIIHGGTNILFDNAPEFFRAESGHAIGYFWGYKTAGIFQTEAEVTAYKSKNGTIIQPTATAGDVKYMDLNEDGKITAADKTDLGDPNPHNLFGLALSCSYKNFDFGANLSGVSGNKIVQSYRNIANRYGNYTTAILGRWTGAGTSNTIPKVTEENNNWSNFSDLYIQDGAYLRLSNVTVGYDFAKLIKFKYLNQCRLYAAAENLVTFTKYNGMDPEVGFSAQGAASSYNFGQGVDIGFYPRPQTFLVGLNIKF